MYKKVYIYIIILQFIIIFSCKSQNLYDNKEVGFLIKIPKKCILAPEGKGLNNYYIRIYVQKPEDLLDGVEQFNKIKRDIENDIYPDIPNIPACFIKFKKINKIKIGIDFHMGYDVFDGVIGKRIFFIKNNKLVSIFLQYEFPAPKDMNDKKNIKLIFQDIEDKYYKQAKNNGIKIEDSDSYVINEIDEYIQKNKNKKTEMPQEVVKLFVLFDKLLSSLKFYK